MKESSLKIFQITEGLSTDLGGTAVAVSHLSNYLAGQGMRVSLFGFCRTTETTRPVALDSRIQLVERVPGRFQRLGFSRKFNQTLEGSDPPSLVHLHGLWRLYYAQGARYAEKHGVPTLLSVHGMLEPWALGRSVRTKQVARILYQDRILRTSNCLHTTADAEAETLRRLGFQRPIAVIPWGVELPPGKFHATPRKELRALTIPSHKRVALFLSRIHFTKGLDLLLPAWSRVRFQFPDWVLVVAGPGEAGYKLKLKKLAKKLGLEGSVFFSGPVHGEEKEAMFGVAELLVLPSRSENFGMVVAEALARGVPVITTKNTPWSKVAEWDCGWWIDLGIEELLQTLQVALVKSPGQLLAMGEAGRRGVEKHFNLNASGEAMLELYRWILGGGPDPHFVRR